MRVIALVNSEGADSASIVYHLAWMYANLDYNVLAADLDPRTRLSGAFLDYAQIEKLIGGAVPFGTIYEAISPQLFGNGEVARPHVCEVAPGLGFVAGDTMLSSVADKLSAAWRDCEPDDGKGKGLHATVGISRALRLAGDTLAADLALMDVGTGFGAVSRAALVAADFVVLPLELGPYSLRGIRQTGEALRSWRSEWRTRRRKRPAPTMNLPNGTMRPVGYVALPPPTRLDRPPDAYGRWMEELPGAYCRHVADGPSRHSPSMADDANCLAVLRHFATLKSLAEEVRKPIFAMKPADGIVGGSAEAVQGCYRDFRGLAQEIAARCGVASPPGSAWDT